MRRAMAMSLVMCLAGVALAQERIAWEGKDSGGRSLAVPAADRPSIVAFVRAGQGQSDDVLAQVGKVVGEAKDVQVLVVVSGMKAEEQGKALSKVPWPVVVDPAFEASGRMGVHVWPTTLVVGKDGRQLAHLAGLADTFSVQLEAYLKYAAGKLDEAGLKARVEAHAVVEDGAEQKAGRHLRLAERMLEQGRLEGAGAELDQAMKVMPGDPFMRASMARALAVLGRSEEAIKVLDGIPEGAVPGWQKGVVRGRALIGLGRWGEAKEALAGAAKLNPEPAEALYLTGIVWQHEGDATRAAEAYRGAFEATPAARGKGVGR